jgi:hypothetical protein
MNGRELRDIGMQRAADKAGEQWQHDAKIVVRLVSRMFEKEGRPFTTEDVRQKSLGYGLEVVGEPRSWGAIMVSAVKDGLIEKVGYGIAANAQAHRRPVTLWRRKV